MVRRSEEQNNRTQAWAALFWRTKMFSQELPGGSWVCFRLVSPALCLPWAGTQCQTYACTSWCTPWSCVWRSHCIQGLRGSCKTSVPCSSPHESAVNRQTDTHTKGLEMQRWHHNERLQWPHYFKNKDFSSLKGYRLMLFSLTKTMTKNDNCDYINMQYHWR